MFKRILALVGLSLSLGQTAVVAEHQEETIDIGSRLELFVDDFLGEEMLGLELMLHSPQSAGKVLNFDKPWEGNTSFYVNILKDDDRYRMYYREAILLTMSRRPCWSRERRWESIIPSPSPTPKARMESTGSGPILESTNSRDPGPTASFRLTSRVTRRSWPACTFSRMATQRLRPPSDTKL